MSETICSEDTTEGYLSPYTRRSRALGRATRPSDGVEEVERMGNAGDGTAELPRAVEAPVAPSDARLPEGVS